MGLFDAFRTKTPAEQLRENKRTIDRAIRELDRERQKMEVQEKKTIAEMKKLAKAGQKDACKILAKDIVRTRAAITNFYNMRAQMSSVSIQMQAMKSQQAMAKAMGSITVSMRMMNRQMNLPALQAMMQDFEKQSMMAEMRQEMVGDILEDVLSAEQEEEEADSMVDRLFDEIGITFTDELGSVPTASGARQQATGAGKDAMAMAMAEQDDAGLQARLDNLRKF